MKNRTLTLFLTLGIIAFTSCNNDDDSSQIETLNGTWNLVESTSFNSVNYDYEEILVTYTFNSNNSSLIVVNNAIETTDLSPKPSGRLGGEYSYNIFENDGKTYLIVQNQNFGEVELGRIIFDQENSLTLNQTEISSGIEISDFIMNFER